MQSKFEMRALNIKVTFLVSLPFSTPQLLRLNADEGHLA